MGLLVKELASCNLEKTFPYIRANRIESAEWIHLHRRNFRFAFTDEQFDQFASDVAYAYANWTEGGRDHGEGDGDVLCDSRIPDSSISPTEVRIEENEYWIHIHVGEMRWMMGVSEFFQLADAVKEAERRLLK